MASNDPRAPRHAIGYLRQEASALRQLGRPREALAAIHRAEELVAETDEDDERPALLLLRSLTRLDLGDRREADGFFTRALHLAGCQADAPCALDLATTTVLRAHAHARRGETDAAFRTLELAIGHRGWTEWMLGAPDLESLRASGDPRWRDLEQRLWRKVREAVEPSGPGACNSASAEDGPELG